MTTGTTSHAARPVKPPPRIRIENVWPAVDCGRRPVKRTDGDTLEVWADIYRDGHEELVAVARHRAPGAATDVEVPMRRHVSGRWRAAVPLAGLGTHTVTIEAWVDRVASWRVELSRKAEAGQEDLASELAEGAELVAGRLRGVTGDDRAAIRAALAVLRSDAPQPERVAAGLDPDLADALARWPDRAEATRADPPLLVDVDRERARFGTWYELFPRSWGGFAGVEAQLPRLAELGVDVLYFPPIHPIGTTHRKGRNNSPTAKPGEPGSPWAIGSPEGGHTAVHPDLGTLDDLRRLVRAAAGHGIEIALDIALQCSPDHPWLTEHPEWFSRRPDGTLKYAENPPKRYQDIYNLSFDTEAWWSLWQALRDLFLFWVEQGVLVFRVDNPHTKPLPFWEWVIAEVRAAAPEAIFLAEAFTHPPMMQALAKAGFSQSYTYFTWRNTRAELTEYMQELAGSPVREFFRPNFFANTPDILHAYLQRGGLPAFAARMVLAATLSPSYGIYSGFEHGEGTPLREGSEEYLDSEKYEVKERALDGPLLPLFARLNAIRRENAALRRIDDIAFLETANEHLIAYAKGAATGRGTIITCVNLDPSAPQEGVVDVPDELGLPDRFTVTDLLTGVAYPWGRGRNYLRLDPAGVPAHVLRVEA
ncbi:MAG: alpha-1,4-glucan--maltose-1-phosphate maltosyltransferase [Actinomycetota bacterium]